MRCIVIDFQDDRYWGDCPMCEQYRRLNHAVGWYCGPTQDEIGSVTTEYTDGGIVGGMCVCQPCHDEFYALTQSTEARDKSSETGELS